MSGTVDRLEVNSDGGMYIIDFKTGKHMVSLKDAPTNKQLQTYQLAIVEGGLIQFTLVGKVLVPNLSILAETLLKHPCANNLLSTLRKLE
ncbi:MAG: PD-(D/E)XK nuclease family protein [Actinomycetota bacterium]